MFWNFRGYQIRVELKPDIQKRQAMPKSYIAAELLKDRVDNNPEFVVGDGTTYGSYNNPALIEGDTYTLYTGTVSRTNETVTFSFYLYRKDEIPYVV